MLAGNPFRFSESQRADDPARGVRSRLDARRRPRLLRRFLSPARPARCRAVALGRRCPARLARSTRGSAISPSGRLAPRVVSGAAANGFRSNSSKSRRSVSRASASHLRLIVAEILKSPSASVFLCNVFRHVPGDLAHRYMVLRNRWVSVSEDSTCWELRFPRTLALMSSTSTGLWPMLGRASCRRIIGFRGGRPRLPEQPGWFPRCSRPAWMNSFPPRSR